MAVSNNQPLVASAGIPLRRLCGRAPLVKNLPMSRFPQHPRGRISSKFYPHSTAVTSLPLKEPKPTTFSPTRARVEERRFGFGALFQAHGKGLLFIFVIPYSLDFSSSQPALSKINIYLTFFSFLLLFSIVVTCTSYKSTTILITF